MATPISTLWKYEPHTEAKHKILIRYLQAWFPILESRHKRVIYFDGFAGPGQYANGEFGSPMLALKLAKEHTATFKGELVFVFVEENEERFQHLAQLLHNEKPALPQNFHIEVLQKNFETVLSFMLDDLEYAQQTFVPMFAFIDPFGFSGVPMRLLHRLLSRERTEAFIYFARNAITRFGDHPSEKIRKHIFDLFGTEEVFNVAKQPDKSDSLRTLYQTQLARKAKFIRYFEMTDQKDKPIYDLFFATNHAKGHVKMKEAMWSLNEWGSFKFSDASIPEQTVLFTPEPASDLLKILLERGKGRANVTFDKMLTWVENETAFLAKHLREALRIAEEKGTINVQANKKGGTKRKRGTFPSGTIIDFSK